MNSRSSTNDNLSNWGITPEAVIRADKYSTVETIANQAFQDYQDEQAELDERIDRELDAKRNAQK